MVIKQNGNVGIGTTNPGSKLQVYSAASSNVFITGYGTSAQNDWGAQNAMFVKTDNGLVISKQNAPNNSNRLYTFYNDASGNAEQYIYNTSNTATIKLDSAGDSYFNGGNVGIGTTSPNAKLNVNGNIKIEGTNSLLFGGSPSVPSWEIKHDGSDLIINDTGTNVGSVLFNNDEGIVLPRLTTTEINAISLPSTGLTVYNTTLNTLCFYNGSSWQKVSHANM
jgi:hypothetical protein